jgi:hypothetical protein
MSSPSLCLNQTDAVFAKDNSQVVALAQPGDTIQVYVYTTFNLSVELLNEDDEVIPLFSYKCPKGHHLRVFYSRDYKLDEEYKELTKEGEDMNQCCGCECDQLPEKNEK